MITTAPQQKFMALGDPRLRSLLLCWPAVRAAFPNTTDDELATWVGNHELPWCFDLGSSDERQFICVLTSSVAEQQQRLLDPKLKSAAAQWSWDDAIKASLPPRPVLLTSALARAWNISADQMDLLTVRIGIVPKNYQLNEPRQLLRANVEKFLKRRAIK